MREMGLVCSSAPLFFSLARSSPTISLFHPPSFSLSINAFHTCLPLSNSSRLCGFSLHAKKKYTDSIATADELLDPDFRASLNELSTEAVKVMLSEQRKRVKAFREKVDGLENLLGKEGDSDAALFMSVIKGMLDHKVVPEAHELKGAYKRAFTKIFGVVEDSGWLLKEDGEETGIKMVDGELIPPTLQSQY